MRGKVLARAAALGVVAVTCVPSSALAQPSSAADNRMASDLRNLATMEETYLTDHNHYGTASELRADGYHLRLAAGQVIYLHLTRPATMNYCFAGRVAPDHFVMYASDRGGIYGPRHRDACDPSAYPHAAGRYPAN